MPPPMIATPLRIRRLSQQGTLMMLPPLITFIAAAYFRR